MNSGSPKLTMAPSSTFSVANSILKKPLQPPFEDEIVLRTVVAAPQDPEREKTTEIRELVVYVAPNVNGGLSQEISELLHQGIKVDDDNEPAPENAQTSTPETQTIGKWVTPTI